MESPRNAEALAAAIRMNEVHLRDVSASLEAVIDNIPLMVFVKDAETLAFVRVNRAGEELLGLSREVLVGKSDHDFWPVEQADFFVARDRETLAKGTLVEIEEELIQTRDKGVRVLRTKKVPILGDDGAPRYLLGISEDVTDRKRSESSLYRLANIDALTGLPNRGLLRDRLDQALTRVRWNGRLVGVLVVDLDRFKSINDSLGHAVGDRLLVEAGARLCAAVRDGDTVGRVGGDDFAVVLTKLDLPAFHALFQLMIVAALLESGTGAVHAVNQRVAGVLTARGRAMPPAIRLLVSSTILVGAIFVANRFGLVALIASGYRLLAYLFLAVYVAPLIGIAVWTRGRFSNRATPAL